MVYYRYCNPNDRYEVENTAFNILRDPFTLWTHVCIVGEQPPSWATHAVNSGKNAYEILRRTTTKVMTT